MWNTSVVGNPSFSQLTKGNKISGPEWLKYTMLGRMLLF